jgi:hypothetical protein
MRAFIFAALICISVSASAQQASTSKPLWEPVTLVLDDDDPTPPTLTREMIPSIRIGQVNVRFDETPFGVVERRFGLTRGQSGDAGDFLQWVCLSGSDARGNWILWLQGGEVNGNEVGGFVLHRVESRRAVDTRCRRTTEAIVIPTGLWLGMSAQAVSGILGTPGRTKGAVSRWAFEHESRDQFTTNVWISMDFVGGFVTTIDVSKIDVN